MRKNFGAKAAMYPMPVLIVATYGKDGTPNAMNAAWGGISEEKEISICIDSGHKTAENLLHSGAFTVSMADADHVAACDYLGIVSANDTPDKLARAGFTVKKSDFVNVPVINELPMALECRVTSYDKETCRLVGEIVNVSAEERVLNEKGKIDPALLRPITYDPMNHTYLILGEAIGRAFSDGKALK